MSLTQRLINLVDVRATPLSPNPPAKLMPFIWYFVGQFKFLLGTMFGLSILSSICNASGPFLLRHIVDTLLSAPSPAEAWPNLTPLLAAYVGVSLVLNNGLYLALSYIRATAFNSGITHVIRRQLHSYLLTHSWSFFQNDFAGRLANKIMDISSEIRNLTQNARRVLVAATWFIVATVSLAVANPWLVIPLFIWATGYALVIRYMMPRVRQLARQFSDLRSLGVGRMVDSYTNIQTVKLFASQHRENSSVTQTLHQARLKHADVLIASFWLDVVTLTLEVFLLASLLVGSILLWNAGLTTPGTIAMVIPLGMMLASQAITLREELSSAIESFGTLEDGMKTLIHPITLANAPDAAELNVTEGSLTFNNIFFRYGPNLPPAIGPLNLTIPAGQRVGLIGASGAGKSTLVNLLLRFFDLTSGEILIDNQNIARVTQESLRSHIGMVTQDTSLLHRSIRENIAYGKPEATEDEIIAAAKLAHAHDFITNLVDKDGRTGYEAHVGERGVKLSGGQRQRIAIARLILKNAPILILDEATSALDSEVEHAIQENLATLMSGKTVIAIAHRLSTIATLDRLLVIEGGQIVEDGTHAELLKKQGTYARLWARQSGGFLPE